MADVIFVLAATILVFSLFLLIFFINGKSGSNNEQRPTCVRCDCHRSQNQHERPPGHLKQAEKKIGPCSAGR